MAENFDAEQTLINANIELINTMVGRTNGSYTVHSKYPHGDNLLAVFADGTDYHRYRITLSPTAPFIVNVEKLILLD